MWGKNIQNQNNSITTMKMKCFHSSKRKDGIKKKRSNM